MQSVRILEMPDCQMVSSGTGMFGEEKFERFSRWFSAQKRSLFPKDFLFWDGSRTELGNIITAPAAQEIMGYEQMDYYVPIKAKTPIG